MTPWTAARQASLSFTISQSLLKLLSIELLMSPTLSSSVAPFSSCPRLSYLLYLGMKPTKKTHVPYRKNGATPSPDIWAWCLLVLVTQSCPTLCDPMDCSPPGSAVHGILQARILEWVAIPFSRGSSPPRNWTQVSWIAVGFFTIWAARGAHVF